LASSWLPLTQIYCNAEKLLADRLALPVAQQDIYVHPHPGALVGNLRMSRHFPDHPL
jgi:hypothetical protein